MKPARRLAATVRAAGGGYRQNVPSVTSIDGRSFPKPISDRIDRLCHLVLGQGSGPELMEFLEGITMRTILPADAPNEVLRDMEGQRRLVAMLKQRLKRAVSSE